MSIFDQMNRICRNTFGEAVLIPDLPGAVVRGVFQTGPRSVDLPDGSTVLTSSTVLSLVDAEAVLTQGQRVTVRGATYRVADPPIPVEGMTDYTLERLS